MYTIHVDGQMIYSSAFYDDADKVLAPILCLETNNTGNLSFTLPAEHSKRDIIKRMKSIIIVKQDDEIIFRGRIVDTELDFFNQLNVYCEGEKSFLRDSVFGSGQLSGNVRDFFHNLISNHNEQVEEEKRFTVGIVDAVDETKELNSASRMETRTYWSTSDMIEDSLLNVYGGYLRTRTIGNAHYIDWVSEYGEANSQPIEFSVNLLDLKNKIDAGDVFTVLIPLGYSAIDDDGNYSEPLTIESVNNGLNYIQNDEAVAMYGKIWRTNTWTFEEDPAKLLEKGRKYLESGIAVDTLTIKAVDMHFVDEKMQAIRIGDMVRILSNPHGLDKTIICSRIEIDLMNPKNTTYTFGEVPRTLTDNFKETEEEVGKLSGGGGGGRSVKEEVTDIVRWALVSTDKLNAQIILTAGELNTTNQRVSEAEIAINGLDSEISLKADKITLEGYVTASKFNAELASIINSISTSIITSSLSAHSVSCSTLSVTDASFRPKTLKYTDADGNPQTMVVLST